MEINEMEECQSEVHAALDGLRQAAASIEDKIIEIEMEVKNKTKALELKQHALTIREESMREVVATKKDKIKFDVGGELFAIKKADLLQHEDSFFYVMLGSNVWRPSADGTYFIDKNPRFFNVILDYLRGEVISLDRLDEYELNEVRSLFNYFHLQLTFTEEDASATPADDKSKKRTRSDELVESTDTPTPPRTLAAASFSSTLKAKVTSSIGRISRTLATIDVALSALQAKEDKLNALDAMVSQHAAQAKDLVHLDVGGKIFTTTRSNLLRHKGSYFHAMLSSGSWLPDDEGVYFINKNPKNFEYLLDYVRNGSVYLDGLEHDHVERILELFEYFQIKIPRPDLYWDTLKCGPDLYLSNGSASVTRAYSHLSCETTAVLGAQSVTRFSVKIEALSPATKALIGFAPRLAFDVNGKNSLNCGWYLELSSGTLISRSTYNKPYSSAIAVGDVLTVIHSTQRNEISFERDGKSLGVAFVDIPRTMHLYPAVDLCCENYYDYEPWADTVSSAAVVGGGDEFLEISSIQDKITLF